MIYDDHDENDGDGLMRYRRSLQDLIKLEEHRGERSMY
jgi:hypothetical protein